MIVISYSWIAAQSTSYVKIKEENLRDTPNGKKIGQVVSGTKLKVLSRKSNWVKVQVTGWIWENSITSDSTMITGYTMRAKHILVETEAEANTILAKLKQGSAFEDLAKEFSIDKASSAKGGDLGEFSRGDFFPEFEETVVKLKAGGVSGIVKSNLGYHIIKRER
jgi:parvulin-like peptidyl-prolyl isomerase